MILKNAENPDFEARVRASFDRQPAMKTINAVLTRVSPGLTEIEMPFSDHLTQQHGFLHAGVLSMGMDSACGFAAYSLMPADAAVLTVEFKINLMAPGRGERFLFRGEVAKPGRTIIVADGKAYAFNDNETKMVASMTATIMTVRGRDGLSG